MIDTLRFKINLTKSQYRKIQRKSLDFTKYDNDKEVEIFRISKNEVPLGSFDRKVSIFIPDEDFCFLEFSVPKFLNGQNVYLISWHDVIVALGMVQKKLEDFFGDFPFRGNWQLMRIDLCYAWKFETQDQAEVMLDILRSFNFGRKKKATYDTSVMYVGQSYSLKFYLKHPEFFRHDFKILRDLGHIDFAYRMLDVAKGVLRFEVTLRKPFLNYHFGKKKIYVRDLREDKLWNIIYQLFDRFMGGFNIKYKTKQQIKTLLITAWGKKKGGRLNVFYSYFITEGKNACREIYASSTVWQYLREIKQAGVPLTYKELKVFELDLTIPSRLVINPCGGTPGSPRTPKKLYISNTRKPYDISDKEVKLKGVNII